MSHDVMRWVGKAMGLEQWVDMGKLYIIFICLFVSKAAAADDGVTDRQFG